MRTPWEQKKNPTQALWPVCLLSSNRHAAPDFVSVEINSFLSKYDHVIK
jgi:hypothetical protein